MKSKLYMNERVKNKDHTFGESDHYYPVKVVLADGSIKRALFTENQLATALDRAVTNSEDFPEKTLLEYLFE